MTDKMSVSDIRRITETLDGFNAEIKGMDVMGKDFLDEAEEGDMDLGTELAPGEVHPDDEECGPPEEVDMVDQMLDEVAATLIDAGYSDEDAEDATFDAVSDLIDEGAIEDTPDLHLDDGIKATYVTNAKPRIYAKLKEMGLEF
jgi:hypothetical protein